MNLIKHRQIFSIALFIFLLPLFLSNSIYCKESNTINWKAICEEKNKSLLKVLKDKSKNDTDKADAIINYGQHVPEKYKKDFWNRSLIKQTKELLDKQIDQTLFYMPKTEPDLRYFEIMAQLESNISSEDFNNHYGLIWNSMAFHWRLYHLLQSPDETKTYNHYYATRFFDIAKHLEKGHSEANLRQFLKELQKTFIEAKKDSNNFKQSIEVAKGCLINIFNPKQEKINHGNIPNETQEAFNSLFNFAEKEKDFVLQFLLKGIYFQRAVHSSASLFESTWLDFEKHFEKLSGPQRFELERRVYRPNSKMWAANRGVLKFLNSLIPPPPKAWYEYRTFIFILLIVIFITWFFKRFFAYRKFANIIDAEFIEIEKKFEKQTKPTNVQLPKHPQALIESNRKHHSCNSIKIGATTKVFNIKGPGIMPSHIELKYCDGDWFYICLNGETKNENKESMEKGKLIKIATDTKLFLGLSATSLLELIKMAPNILQVTFKTNTIQLSPEEN